MTPRRSRRTPWPPWPRVDGVADAVASIEAARQRRAPDQAQRRHDPHRRPAAAGLQLDRQRAAQRVHAGRRRPARRSASSRWTSIPPPSTASSIGDTYEVMMPGGRVDLTLSGTSSFGADNSTLGAVLMQMNTAQASELFGVDGINSVAVQVADGADVAAVQAAVAAAVPDRRGRRPRHRARRDDARSSPTRSTSSATSCSDSAASRCSCRSSSSTTRSPSCSGSGPASSPCCAPSAPIRSRSGVRSLGEALAMGVLASAGGIVGGIAVAKGIDALFGADGRRPLRLAADPRARARSSRRP